MVDPISAFSAVSMGLSAASSLVGGIGAAGASGSAAAMARYQASVARLNQQVAEDNARRAIERSQIEQEMVERENQARIGQQLAGQAASGLSTESGSFIRARDVAGQLARLDALNVRQAGELESYGYKVDAAGFASQAQLSNMEAASHTRAGRTALLSSFLQAGGSLISKASPSVTASRYAPSSSGPRDIRSLMQRSIIR